MNPKKYIARNLNVKSGHRLTVMCQEWLTSHRHTDTAITERRDKLDEVRQGVSIQFPVKLKFPEVFFFFFCQKQKKKNIEQLLLTLDLFYTLPLEKGYFLCYGANGLVR